MGFRRTVRQGACEHTRVNGCMSVHVCVHVNTCEHARTEGGRP